MTSPGKLRPTLSRIAGAALPLAASFGAAAHAAPITYEYRGVISSADPSTGVAAGTPFSGIFTYDPKKLSFGIGDAADADTAYYGKYPQSLSGSPSPDTSPGTGLSLQVSGHPVVSPDGSLTIGTNESNYPHAPGYGSAAGLFGPFSVVDVMNGDGTGNPINVTLDLKNPTRSVSDLPMTLASFPIATLDVTSGTVSSPQTLYTGTIDSLTVVPEPATATALCLAVAAWLARSRHRHSG